SAGMLPLYEYEVPAVTLSFIDSLDTKSYSWSSSKLFVHVQGNNTPYDQSDDIFEIAGESSGTDINGVSFTASTEESLGNYFDCRWIRTGKTLLSIPGLDVSTGYIDYIGEDSCTNIIMYSFNGNPFYDRFIYH
ncbi:MAG TPA: hypothetical protein VK994_08485, partial [Bacteroidales bacterium]|nr:hypothetical protein [Bacteroidales bacterium]